MPERLRLERSRELIWAVLGIHLTPDQEHQTGAKPGLEKAGVASQSLKVLRGSLMHDFRERREISWRGREEVVVVAAAAERAKDG